MKIISCITLLIVLMTSSAYSQSVGLQINGGAGFIFKPGGASQWLANAPSYYEETYDQPSYRALSNATDGYWQGRWSDGSGNMADYEGKAMSKAKADFGSLGVYSYAWVSDKTTGVNTPYTHYDWNANASAKASFMDLWRVDVPGLAAGTVGTLSVNVHLDGSRTDDIENHSSSLGLTFGNYSTASHQSLGSDVYAGDYLITVAFKYGQDNNIYMGLTSGNSSFNVIVGGESYVDFYNTATITGLTFRDANNTVLNNYTMTTGSAHNYSTVPEPATILGLAIPTLMVGLGRLRRLRK